MVYDLVLAKNGPKLKEGVPNGAADGFCGGFRIGSIEAKSCYMSWLANLLARFAFETDVFDKTGLTGVYDFQNFLRPNGPFRAR